MGITPIGMNYVCFLLNNSPYILINNNNININIIDGEPNKVGKENCALLYVFDNSTWHDDSCWDGAQVITEIDNENFPFQNLGQYTVVFFLCQWSLMCACFGVVL